MPKMIHAGKAVIRVTWSALAAPDVDFVFVRHDSAYFMQAWSALAAPDVCKLSATEFIHRAVEDGIGSNLSCLAVIT